MKRCVSVCSCGDALTIAQGMSCTLEQWTAYVAVVCLWLHVHVTGIALQIIHELSSENEELKEELEQAHAAHEDIDNPSRCCQRHACHHVLPSQYRITHHISVLECKPCCVGYFKHTLD